MLPLSFLLCIIYSIDMVACNEVFRYFLKTTYISLQFLNFLLSSMCPYFLASKTMQIVYKDAAQQCCCRRCFIEPWVMFKCTGVDEDVTMKKENPGNFIEWLEHVACNRNTILEILELVVRIELVWRPSWNTFIACFGGTTLFIVTASHIMVTIEAWWGYWNTCCINFNSPGFLMGYVRSSVKGNTWLAFSAFVPLESMAVPRHRFLVTITFSQAVESDIKTCLTVGIFRAWICCFHV